eukprot:scaffold13852_cov89-Skeletonema_marinoi.AAC.2
MEFVCVLFGKSEGLGMVCGRHRETEYFCEDGKNFRSIVSDRVLISVVGAMVALLCHRHGASLCCSVFGSVQSSASQARLQIVVPKQTEQVMLTSRVVDTR